MTKMIVKIPLQFRQGATQIFPLAPGIFVSDGQNPAMNPLRGTVIVRRTFAQLIFGMVLFIASTAPSFATELLVCDASHGAILRFDASSGTYLGALVSDPNLFLTAMTFDSSGYLYLSCYNSNSIRRYNAKTGVFLGTFATLQQPYDLAF
jgi:hypothetical protein